MRRAPDARLHARGRLLAAEAPRGAHRLVGLPRQGRRHRRGHVPRGLRDARGMLPEGGKGARGGGARRARVPGFPALALEAPAHQQRAGARQQGNQAPLARGAGIPLRKVAAQGGRGRHVRPGGDVVRIAILLGEEDGGDARRRVQDGCRGRARLGGAGEDGQEDDRIQPGTCRQRGAGVGYQQIPGLGQGSEVALTPTFPTLPTITGKSYKVSYKSKKTKKNPEEKQYFFPNTHEPLIDEETFDLAQKRIATKHRPTKTEEIDIFSGLLFCGDCGYKMYLQQGAGTLERKHAYTCGKYRNRIRTGELCTTHYIRKSVLKELVLADLQRVLSYVKEHEQEFIETANECSAKAVQKTLTQQRKELDKAQSRISELNILFRKLYEDNALGKLSDEQFAFLTSGYDEEKKTLTRRIAELTQEIDNATERSADVKRFVALVRRYTTITELTYENVHEFIDRILIHELDKETNTRKIEIFYSFVGRVDTGDKPTESISYFRQIGADVKSYAI